MSKFIDLQTEYVKICFFNKILKNLLFYKAAKNNGEY